MSVRLTQNPAVSGLLILMLHCRPGDAVSYLLTMFATILIFCPGPVEGSAINLLRVRRQMCPNG